MIIKLIFLGTALLILILLVLRNRKRCRNCIFYLSDNFKQSVGKCVYNRKKQKIVTHHEKCKKFSKNIHYKKWFFFLFFTILFLHHNVQKETIVYVPVKKAYVKASLKNKEYSKQFQDIVHYKSPKKERVYIRTLEKVQYRNFRMISYETINVRLYSINGHIGFKPGFERTIDGKKVLLGGDYYMYQLDNPYHFYNFLNNDSNYNNHQFLFDTYHTDMLNQLNTVEGSIFAYKEVIDDVLILKFYSDYEMNSWNGGFIFEMIIRRT